MYLGVDGGGTKTDFLLIDGEGSIKAHVRSPTSHYLQIGMTAAQDIIRRGITKACELAGIGLPDIRYSFLGLPGFGEDLQGAAEHERHMKEILGGNLQCGNDVEAGWAGSLACLPGINLVCGTGAIGFGKDTLGNAARSSGWGYFCGDEGSAHWLGKKVIELFSKQSDFRLPKTPLYEITKKTLGLQRDFDLIDYVHFELKMERDQIAGLAQIMQEAASAGDSNAIEAYKTAAYENSLTVKAILSQLKFDPSAEVTVSYSGGVFKAGDLILKPLRSYLESSNVVLAKPLLEPILGAALYAVILEEPNKDYPQALFERLKEQQAAGALSEPARIEA
ncbi:MAG TPA: ATPase [Firmicutes bacterium]|nr:ATPase [Bacillota bacterium]